MEIADDLGHRSWRLLPYGRLERSRLCGSYPMSFGLADNPGAIKVPQIEAPIAPVLRAAYSAQMI